MEKVIQIEEGRSAAFRASAFSPIQYNRLFPGRDFMRDMNDLRSMSERTQPAEGGKERRRECQPNRNSSGRIIRIRGRGSTA